MKCFNDIVLEQMPTMDPAMGRDLGMMQPPAPPPPPEPAQAGDISSTKREIYDPTMFALMRSIEMVGDGSINEIDNFLKRMGDRIKESLKLEAPPPESGVKLDDYFKSVQKNYRHDYSVARKFEKLIKTGSEQHMRFMEDLRIFFDLIKKHTSSLDPIINAADPENAPM